jgi:hypothetical protein
MNTRFPDALDQRSRLISLVYEVLREMETPTEGATDMAMCSAISRAFSDHAIALLDLGTAASPTPRKSPRICFQGRSDANRTACPSAGHGDRQNRGGGSKPARSYPAVMRVIARRTAARRQAP